MMTKTRLEAFSDGVIAIILTIMVLELKVPKEPTLEALGALWPVYVAYALSYLNVFLAWLDHHDIFASLEEVDHTVLLANGLLLFCVSLVPFVTAFAGEAHWREPLPVMLYGLVMAAVSLAFARLRVMARRLAKNAAGTADHREEARKSLRMAALFLVAAACAWFLPRAAPILFVLIPLTLRRRKRNA
jgi:uncharacterized membrane protein